MPGHAFKKVSALTFSGGIDTIPPMQVIRLARGGRSKYPTYRIVAAESARAATGKFIEILGSYNPHTKELSIKREETLKRISFGAQPSNSVIKLLQREKMDLPNWVQVKTKTPRKVEEPEVEAPVKAEAAEAAEDASASEEAPAEQEAVEEAKAEEASDAPAEASDEAAKA